MIGTRARLVVTTIALLGGGVGAATSSGAVIGPECFGDSNAAVCVTVDPGALPTVNPTGGTPITDCLFVGPPPCVPVSVPTPALGPGDGGSLVVVQCSGTLIPSCPTGSVSASSGAATLVGQGTISPGLTIAGNPAQSFTFAGSGAIATASGQGAFSCTFSGNDTIGSISRSSGSFSGSCSMPCGGFSTSGTYDRNDTVMTMRGTGAGCVGSGFSATCAWSPTNFDASGVVTAYSAVCRMVFT